MKHQHCVCEEDRSDWRRGRYEPGEPPEAEKAIDRDGTNRGDLRAKPVRPQRTTTKLTPPARHSSVSQAVVEPKTRRTPRTSSGGKVVGAAGYFPSLQTLNFRKGHMTRRVAGWALHVAIFRRRARLCAIAVGAGECVHRHTGATGVASVAKMNCADHGGIHRAEGRAVYSNFGQSSCATSCHSSPPLRPLPKPAALPVSLQKAR